MQNAQMESLYTSLCINEIRSPVRKDGLDTHIRIAKYNELPCNELTGYIDFEEFIAFFVLFTPEELQGRNVRKLNHLLQYSNPIKVKFNNTIVIDKLKVELLDITIPVKRASAYNQLANCYSEMDNECEAMNYRRLCWDTDPEYYENITPLILGELKFNNIESAISYSVEFFSLNSKNPRVMQDFLSFCEEEKYRDYFEQLINRLKAKYEGENEALGNILFHYAIYLCNTEKKDESMEHFKLSRDLFFKVDENHYAIQQINDTLIENNI